MRWILDVRNVEDLDTNIDCSLSEVQLQHLVRISVLDYEESLTNHGFSGWEWG